MLADSAGLTLPTAAITTESRYRLNEVTLGVTALGPDVTIFAPANVHVASGEPGYDNHLVLDVSGGAVSTGVTSAPGRHGWKQITSFLVTDFMDVSASVSFTSGDTFFARVREVRDDLEQRVVMVSRLTVP